MATKATYKIYDATQQEWIEYYFKTSADQIGTGTIGGVTYAFITNDSASGAAKGTKINGKQFTMTTVSGFGSVASLTLDGTEIGSNVSAYSGTTPMTPSASGLHYLANADTVAGALAKLDQAAYEATQAATGYLKLDGTTTMTGTLKVKADASLSPSIESATGNLRIFGANTIIDSGNDVTLQAGLTPTSDGVSYGKVKIKAGAYTASLSTTALNEDVTFNFPGGTGGGTLVVDAQMNSSNIIYAGNKIYPLLPPHNVTEALDKTYANAAQALQLAQGKNSSYAINCTGTFDDNDIVNASFNDPTGADITISWSAEVLDSSGTLDDSDKYLVLAEGSDESWISLNKLHVGDNVFIKELNIPDRWVSGLSYTPSTTVGATVTGTITFSKLETVKVDLGWSNLGTTTDPKPTTISGYGITDAKITTSNSAKTITLGSETYTASSSNPTASWGSAVTVGTVGGVDLKFTMPSAPSYNDTQNTTGGDNSTGTKLFLTGMTAQTTSNGSARTYTNSGVYIGTDNRLYANSKILVSCYAGTTQPSNAANGDIWIDTTN